MKILIIDNAESEDGSFNVPLTEVVGRLCDYETVHYKDVHLDDSVGGVILSGVPLHYPFEAVDQRQPYLAWLRETAVPVLGICLGHQSIGMLHGAPVMRDLETEDDLITVRIVQDDPLFSGLWPTFRVRAMHRTSIPVPEGFTLLASSKRCVNQIMKHTQKNIYGMQFHPELSPDGETLLRNFVAIARAKYEENLVRYGHERSDGNDRQG